MLPCAAENVIPDRGNSNLIVQSGESNPNNQAARFYAIALVALCLLVFFYGLGWLPLIGPDEPRYAEVAREMFVTGDWITPRLGEIKWFEKPALTYWLSCAGYGLFGQRELGARFGIALFALLGVLLVYVFGKRVRSARFGYLSAAVLATCGLWPGFARGATFDLPLSVAMMAALFAFFLWEREEPGSRARWALWLAFGFALGLGALAKGLVGIALPLMILMPYLLFTGGWRAVVNAKLLLIGSAVCLATASVWYGPVIARNGHEFISEFFIAHHFQRYLTNKYRHPQPVYFFPLVVVAGSFPWSFFLLANLWRAVKGWRKLRADRLRLLLLLWLVVPVIFFSFSGSKLPGYILPVFPALALLIGDELDRRWEAAQFGWLGVLMGLLIALAGVGVSIIGPRELGMSGRGAWLMAAVTIAVALVYLALLALRDNQRATLFLPFGLAVIVIAAAHLIFPALGQRESLRPLARRAIEVARPGERLVFYVNYDHGINFYATGLPLRDNKSELVTLFSSDEVATLADASPSRSLLLASPARWAAGLTASNKVRTEELGRQELHARCSPDCDWVLLRAQRR